MLGLLQAKTAPRHKYSCSIARKEVPNTASYHLISDF